MTIHVREFRMTDAPDVVRMMRGLALHHGQTSKLHEDFLRDAANMTPILVARGGKSERQIGFLTFAPEVFLEQNAAYYRLTRLYVDKEARDQGVARALVRAVAQRAMKRKITGLSLSFRRANEGLEGFYQKLGFDINLDHPTTAQAWLIGDRLKALAVTKS